MSMAWCQESANFAGGRARTWHLSRRTSLWCGSHMLERKQTVAQHQEGAEVRGACTWYQNWRIYL